MDKALYDRGMTMRRKVLGDEYVDRAVANTDDFNRQFHLRPELPEGTQQRSTTMALNQSAPALRRRS